MQFRSLQWHLRVRRKGGLNSSFMAQHALQWRHKGRDGVSNHQPHDCLPTRLFRRRPKVRVTGLCAENSPVTGAFTAQMTSNTGNISIWWRLMIYIHPKIYAGGLRFVMFWSIYTCHSYPLLPLFKRVIHGHSPPPHTHTHYLWPKRTSMLVPKFEKQKTPLFQPK